MSIYDQISEYAVEKARRDLRTASEQYDDAVARGDVDEATNLLRHVRYHSQELAELTPQQQLTPRQASFLAQRPSIRDNPQKLAALRDDYLACLKAGVPDDSDEMFRILSGRHDPQPGNAELPDPRELVDIVSRSRHFNGDKDEARRALHKSWGDVQAELRNRGGRWENK